MPNFIDITGRRFFRLVAVGIEGKDKYNRYLWRFRCDCGNEVVRLPGQVKIPSHPSCGCWGREHAARLGACKRKHGRTGTKVYATWARVKRRCLSPDEPCYPRYGGRGITLCEAWMDFEAFCADMGEPPTPKHTIERIDNDGPYSPENCRWATQPEQMQNQRRTRRITHMGITQSVTAWSRAFSVGQGSLNKRIRRGEPLLTAVAAIRERRGY